MLAFFQSLNQCFIMVQLYWSTAISLRLQNMPTVYSASKKKSASKAVDRLKDAEAITSLELMYEMGGYRRNTCYLLAGRLVIKG